MLWMFRTRAAPEFGSVFLLFCSVLPSDPPSGGSWAPCLDLEQSSCSVFNLFELHPDKT